MTVGSSSSFSNENSPLIGIGDAAVVPYETLLSQNVGWAMSEGGRYFEGRSKVQESLRRICARLEELGIPYAVAGGMALGLQGYQRFTDDVDILVTRAGLDRIHAELDGLGYVRRFATSKNLRDTDSGVKIEFLITGSFPGDGKPKDIAFPDPSQVADVRDGIRVLNIPTLVSLKIASFMTGEGRSKDIGDVEELIKLLDLPESLSQSLHTSVREKYLETWRRLHVKPKRYVLLWRNKWLTAHAKTIDEMIDALKGAASELVAMQADGVFLDSEGGTEDDYSHLITTNRAIAEKYQMEDESEQLEDDDDPSNNPARDPNS